MVQFKDIFSELRKDTGLSQEKFAEMFHQSSSTISGYETGRNTPSYDLLIQYADYFKVTTDYLIGRTAYDMPPDVLLETLVDDATVRDIIELVRNLPVDRRRALLLLLKDLQFSFAVQEHTNHNIKGG